MNKKERRLFYNSISAAFGSDWTTQTDVDESDVMGIPIASEKNPRRKSRFIPREALGGYWFLFDLLLRRKDPNFRVYFLNNPRNNYQRDALWEARHLPGCFLPLATGDKIIMGFGDFTVADLGLALWTAEQHFPDGYVSVESKLAKRAKNLFRPTRINTHSIEAFEAGAVSRPHGWNIVPIVKTPALDGWGVVSERLFQHALHRQTWANKRFQPAVEAQIKNRIDVKAPVDNFRTLGMHYYAQDLGNLDELLAKRGLDSSIVVPPEEICVDLDSMIIEGMTKGNFVRDPDLPPGIDMLVPLDQLKPEITATRPGAVMLCEPQSPKGGREDQQQTVTNRFLTASVPEARATLRKSSDRFFESVLQANSEEAMDQLAKDDYNTPYKYDGDGVARQIRWNLMHVKLYGLSPDISRYLSRQQLRQWVAKVGAHNVDSETDDGWDRNLKIPVDNAIRAQVISTMAANLGGDPIKVERRHFAWSKKLQCFVVSDWDWVNVIIPSHGGCDLDDFFMIRFRIVDGVLKAIIVRNPLSRGEYTMWDIQNPEEMPPGIDLDKATVLSLKRRPVQILEATSGDKPLTTYLELPSQKRAREFAGQITKVVRPYQGRDFARALDNRVRSGGSVGEVINGLLAVLSDTVTWYPEEMPYSEDAVDVFQGADDPLDQLFLMDWRDVWVGKRVESGKPMDSYVAKRIPEEVPVHAGDITKLKDDVILQVVDEHEERSEAFVNSLSIPPWLEDFKGNPESIQEATEILKEARRKHRKASQEGKDPFVVVGNYIREMMEVEETELARNQFLMSLWYAMWTVPTSKGDLNDAYLFGPKTELLPLLMKALVYFGVAREPYITEDGRLDHYPNPNPYHRDLGKWEVTCENGGESLLLSAHQFRYYLQGHRSCSQHK